MPRPSSCPWVPHANSAIAHPPLGAEPLCPHSPVFPQLQPQGIIFVKLFFCNKEYKV